MCAKKSVGRPEFAWTFNYHDLARISGKSINSIQASRRRPGGFDPDDLLSVALWIARNAPSDTKMLFLKHLTEIPIVIETHPRKKKPLAE